MVLMSLACKHMLLLKAKQYSCRYRYACTLHTIMYKVCFKQCTTVKQTTQTTELPKHSYLKTTPTEPFPGAGFTTPMTDMFSPENARFVSGNFSSSASEAKWLFSCRGLLRDKHYVPFRLQT